jgi:hypothetical protein
MVCKSSPRKAGQSAVPATSCDLTLIKPQFLAASGSLRMTMNSPPTRGKMANTTTLSHETRERRALRASAQNAAANPCFILLQSGA